MKNRKLIYLFIFLIIIAIPITFYLWPKKEEYKVLPIEVETQKQEEPIASTPPTLPVIEYLITKDYKIIPKDSKGDKKIVLLTFDDGPSNQSIEIVKILKAHNVKAIFFINGMHDKANPGAIKAEAEAGFPIGNHTWSHINLLKTKKTELIDKEINSNNELIAKITSSLPRFFRSPYGVSSPYSNALIKKENMISMNWSDAAKDWEKNTKDEKIFIKNVTDGLKPGAIILLHEHPWSLANLDALLTTLEKEGYSFADPNNIVQ